MYPWIPNVLYLLYRQYLALCSGFSLNVAMVYMQGTSLLITLASLQFHVRHFEKHTLHAGEKMEGRRRANGVKKKERKGLHR